MIMLFKSESTNSIFQRIAHKSSPATQSLKHTSMASVLHPTLAPSPNLASQPSSSSRTPSAPVFNASPVSRNHKIHHFSSLQHRGNCDFSRGVACQSSSGEVDLLSDLGLSKIGSLKNKLLIAVSGLNRGLAASEDDLRKAEAAAKELESEGGAVNLAEDLDKLQGQWKLIYSSAFSGRTLGGSRPGPPTGRLLPITLGQVFQRIDVFSKDFDNIVELELGAPWPFPTLEATATLAHKFELIGTCGIKITFDKTTVKTRGTLSQLPPLDVPRIPDALRQSSNTGSGEFEVTYLDSDTRVTRGDRSELRVFVIA